MRQTTSNMNTYVAKLERQMDEWSGVNTNYQAELIRCAVRHLFALAGRARVPHVLHLVTTNNNRTQEMRDALQRELSDTQSRLLAATRDLERAQRAAIGSGSAGENESLLKLVEENKRLRDLVGARHYSPTGGHCVVPVMSCSLTSAAGGGVDATAVAVQLANAERKADLLEAEASFVGWCAVSGESSAR